MTETAVAKRPIAAVEPNLETGSVALMRLIERAATSPDFDVEKLEKLFDVKERWEKNEARKAFVSALGAFKASPPSIVKNKHVAFDTSKGGRTEYDHATLDQVSEIIGKALSEHGLSHTWKINQDDNAAVQVTCVLTHALGHAEETTLRAMPDNSGGKNLIQQIGSTVTYLERYTLLAATGLAAADQDQDGADGGGAVISADQKETLIGLIKETNADTAKLCQYLGVASVDEILAATFDFAKQALEKKRAQK